MYNSSVGGYGNATPEHISKEMKFSYVNILLSNNISYCSRIASLEGKLTFIVRLHQVEGGGLCTCRSQSLHYWRRRQHRGQKSELASGRAHGMYIHMHICMLSQNRRQISGACVLRDVQYLLLLSRCLFWPRMQSSMLCSAAVCEVATQRPPYREFRCCCTPEENLFVAMN